MQTVNARVPLADNTPITENITIVRLISKSGGSSLTYLAQDKRSSAYLVIKEFFPFCSKEPFVREAGGCRVFCGSEEEIARLRLKFMTEMENARELAVTKSHLPSNSIRHFPQSEITQEVVCNSRFAGTAALYMAIDTRAGMTLSDIGGVSLHQMLFLVREILLSLRKMHSENRMLHLDIKDDNLFFPSELSLNRTYCIILDSGSAIKMDELTSPAFFSATAATAAPEVCKAMKYGAGGLCPDREKFEWYCALIGAHTDTYSVGAVAYKLLMGEKFNYGRWKKIRGARSQNSILQMLTEDMQTCWGAQYPYLIPRLAAMFARALYVPASWTAEELTSRRYASCEDFIRDIGTLLEILDQRGVHPEVILEQSRQQLLDTFRIMRVDPENPFDERMFTKPRKEQSNNQGKPREIL